MPEKAGMRLRLDAFDVVSLFVIGSILGLLLALMIAGGGCAPETDLTRQPRGAGAAPGGAGAGGAPAGAVLVDPEAGAVGVPVNLAAVVLRFAGAAASSGVALGPEAVRVCPDVAGGPVVVTGVQPAACGSGPGASEGGCWVAALGAALPAASSCRIELGEGVVDGDGAPVPPGLVGVFETAAAADQVPPVLTGVSVELAGPCIAVRFATDEPASGAVMLRAQGEGGAAAIEQVIPAGAGQTVFDVAVPASLLPPSAPATVTARATDRAGNTVESAPLALTTPPPLPPLVITEVLANPLGAEPAQEFVEIRNAGGETLALDGLVIQDAKGMDALPAGSELGAGAYGLVVTSAYDAAGGVDPAPRPGTTLLRVDTRIGSDGLSNAGEAVRLVLGEAVVSSYGGWVAVSSSAWAGKSAHRLVETACDRPDAWSRAPLAPTPGSGPP